jgi:molecular chaperone GrpE
MMVKPTKKTTDDQQKLLQLVEELQNAVTKAQESEKRAVADYQNLIRRNQFERSQLVKLATKGLTQDLLQPLDHLALAAKQLNDPGLNMVISQFWQKLQEHGLEEINPVGEPFDVTTMEAVELNGKDQDDASLVVTQVRQKGYKLNGEVIQFARVVLKSK